MKPRISSIISEDTLRSKILKGIAWSFLGTAISKGMLLFSFIIIARILSIDEYGEFGIIRNFIVTFSMFSVASFGVTATKYIATYKDNDLQKTARILSVTQLFVLTSSFLIFFGVLLFSGYISNHLLHNENLKIDVQITAFTVLFTALNGYQNGVLAGFENFKGISFVNIANGLLILPIITIGAYYWRVHGVIVGLALISFLTWVSSLYFLHLSKKEHSITIVYSGLKNELNILFEFSLPSFLSGIIVAPVIFLLNTMLARYEYGYFQLGLFNAAVNFSIISLTLNQIIGQVFFPYAMKYFDKGKSGFEFANIIFPWIVSIVINLPILLFPEVTSYIYGEKYNVESYKLSVVIVAFYSIIISYKQGIARNFAAANLMWWSVFGNGFWAFIAFLSALFFVAYGAAGLAMSFAIAHILSNILLIPLYVSRKLISEELIFSKISLFLWLLVTGAALLYFMALNASIKIAVLIMMYTIMTFLVVNWWNSFTQRKLDD